jgi:hypothetical protein
LFPSCPEKEEEEKTEKIFSSMRTTRFFAFLLRSSSELVFVVTSEPIDRCRDKRRGVEEDEEDEERKGSEGYLDCKDMLMKLLSYNNHK